MKSQWEIYACKRPHSELGEMKQWLRCCLILLLVFLLSTKLADPGSSLFIPQTLLTLDESGGISQHIVLNSIIHAFEDLDPTAPTVPTGSRADDLKAFTSEFMIVFDPSSNL